MTTHIELEDTMLLELLQHAKTTLLLLQHTRTMVPPLLQRKRAIGLCYNTQEPWFPCCCNTQEPRFLHCYLPKSTWNAVHRIITPSRKARHAIRGIPHHPAEPIAYQPSTHVPDILHEMAKLKTRSNTQPRDSRQNADI